MRKTSFPAPASPAPLAPLAMLAALAALAALAGLAASCASYYRAGKHDLAWTRGEVKFATSHKRFYAEKWIRRIRAGRRRLCAGFVHKETFSRYLKYGNFFLHIKLQVYRGGSPVISEKRIIAWQGGQLVRTREKHRGVAENQDVYVFCSRLHKRARRTVGAMKFTFRLMRVTPPSSIPLATGYIQIVP